MLNYTQQFELQRARLELSNPHTSKEEIIDLFIELLTVYFKLENTVKETIKKQLGIEEDENGVPTLKY